MSVRSFRAALAIAALAASVPLAAQQFSESYQFLEAVRKADGQKVTDILKQPGASIINTKSDEGEGALHIVAKRSDSTYMRFLLQSGANPNIQDRSGNTPMIFAVNQNSIECVDALVAYKANVNLANSSGETPLIRAVQLRNVDMARHLLEAGANADQTDNVAGMSARDYAKRETRMPALTKLLTDAPVGSTRRGAGPN